MREVWMRGGRRWNLGLFIRTGGVAVGIGRFRQAGWWVVQIDLVVLIVQVSWLS